MNNKGVSGIIATIIMIALVLVIAGALWATINNLVGDKISSSESCFGNFGKVTLNKQFTCKDTVSNEIDFAISRGDIDLDKILVSVEGPSGTKSFEITNSSAYSYVKMYNGAFNGTLQLPDKNAGLTYSVGLVQIGITDATTIKIAPIINGNQCEVSDSVTSLNSC